MRHRSVKPAALCDNTEFGGYAAGFVVAGFAILFSDDWQVGNTKSGTIILQRS
jgi:hypothetical protein